MPNIILIGLYCQWQTLKKPVPETGTGFWYVWHAILHRFSGTRFWYRTEHVLFGTRNWYQFLVQVSWASVTGICWDYSKSNVGTFFATQCT